MKLFEFWIRLKTAGEHSKIILIQESAVREIMQKPGYSENPILIHGHYDMKNNNIHIVTSRLGVNEKKIKDNFEGKRANHYMNAILNRKPHQGFNNHLNSSLTYKFGTHAQFALLMELNGYKTQKKDNQFLFFKHGEKQGHIDLSDLDKKISIDVNVEKNANQIKALIYKYRKQYSGELHSNHDNKFTTEPKKFESDLTNFLKQKFGYDFIFFSGKDKEMPYGYVLIDHNSREVYKGSDLLKLDVLITDAAIKGEASNTASSRHEYPEFFAEDNKEKLQQDNEYKSEIQLGEILDDFLREIERANYQGDGRAKNMRNKRRRGI